MLVFNEGVPRAGKSYDAVKSHILPALKKRRRVFARLNGLDHDRIADYLDMPREDVRELLQLVETKDVAARFVCVRDEASGQWGIADEFKNALIVIDEVHEFYVNERKPLPPEVENFWALLGQNGGDAVILTQWLNRLHSAIKARIERKHSFQKLSALGADGKYRVTYYQTIAAGKFEKIGGATLSYDKAIFPLYHGYAPGADNVEVYKEGSTNVWKAMLLRAAIFGTVGLLGVWGLLNFFLGGGGGLTSGSPAEQVQQPPQEAVQSFDLQGNLIGTEAAPTAAGGVPVPMPDPYADLTAEQRYVATLVDRGRIRLGGRVQFGGEEQGVVEWVDSAGETVESLTVAALRDLGYEARFTAYGLRLSAGEHVVIATPWPRVYPKRESDQRLYNLSPAAGAAPIASVASERGGDGGGTIAGSIVAGNPAEVVGAGIRGASLN